MSSKLFKSSKLIVPLCIVLVLIAVMVFMAQPGLYLGNTAECGVSYTVTTQPATNIGTNSATLNGHVEATVDNTAGRKVFAGCGECYGFRYGTYPGAFGTPILIDTFTPGYFSYYLANLNPFTTYMYQALVMTCVSQSYEHVVFAIFAEYGDTVLFTTQGNTAAINPSTSSDVSPTVGIPANVTTQLNNNSFVTQVNQPVTVAANVINSGDVEGGFTVNLKVNGYIEQTKMGVIPGHEAESVEFTIVKEVPGTYELDIEGNTATLTVLAAEQSSSFTQSQIIFIAGIGLAIILIAFVAVMMMRRRASQ